MTTKPKKTAADRLGEFIGISIIVLIFLPILFVSLAISWKAFSWAFGL